MAFDPALYRAAELPEEANIIFAEEAQVIDTVQQHGNAFDTHPKCIARVLIAVDATIFQDFGMHHATA